MTTKRDGVSLHYSCCSTLIHTRKDPILHTNTHALSMEGESRSASSCFAMWTRIFDAITHCHCPSKMVMRAVDGFWCDANENLRPSDAKCALSFSTPHTKISIKWQKCTTWLLSSGTSQHHHSHSHRSAIDTRFDSMNCSTRGTTTNISLALSLCVVYWIAAQNCDATNIKIFILELLTFLFGTTVCNVFTVFSHSMCFYCLHSIFTFCVLRQ